MFLLESSLLLRVSRMAPIRKTEEDEKKSLGNLNLTRKNRHVEWCDTHKKRHPQKSPKYADIRRKFHFEVNQVFNDTKEIWPYVSYSPT